MFRYLVFSTLFFMILTSCRSNVQEGKAMNEDVTEALRAVAKARIFFGHQSVGQNIVDGLKELVKESGDTSLHIVDIHKTKQLPQFYFAHTKVGKNTKPASKCREFAAIIDNKLAQTGLQYAFLKFCFVDITAKTDVTAVFDQYRQTLDSLKARHPQIRFVHFTVPLKAKTKGLKAALKRWFGKPGRREVNNMRRMEYNRLLKKYYHGEPIFDIAAIESTYPDGKRETFTKNGKTYYALIDAYSTDGGHLNETGKKRVAGKLLLFLSGLIKGHP